MPEHCTPTTHVYPRCTAHDADAPILIRIGDTEEAFCVQCIEQNHAALAAVVRDERARDLERRPAFWAMWGDV